MHDAPREARGNSLTKAVPTLCLHRSSVVSFGKADISLDAALRPNCTQHHLLV